MDNKPDLKTSSFIEGDIEIQPGTEAHRLVWVKVEDAAKLLFKDNPKLHDMGQLIESFQKYGFKELPLYDSNLINSIGEKGAIQAGNGRIEALARMRTAGLEPPRGVALTKDGSWAVQILLGIDASSEALAMAYALDSNNLTLAGGGFTAADMMRLYDERKYLSLLKGIVGEDAGPVTVDGDVLDALIASNRVIPPEDFKEYDDTIETEFKCPKCGYEWSGKPG
jgi:hypothetical protein